MNINLDILKDLVVDLKCRLILFIFFFKSLPVSLISVF